MMNSQISLNNKNVKLSQSKESWLHHIHDMALITLSPGQSYVIAVVRLAWMTLAIILSIESHSSRIHKKTRLLLCNLKGACKQLRTFNAIQTLASLYLVHYFQITEYWWVSGTMFAYTQFIKMFGDAGQQSGDLTLHSFLL